MREPDLVGTFGQAWDVHTTRSQVPDHQACIGSWVVNVPGAHPYWEHWLVTIIHLRDIPGVRPAYKKYPEAAFEFAIHSIDPMSCPEPDPDKALEGYPLLTPVDVVEQFHGLSDRDAKRVAVASVHAILDGHMSPDQDFRSMWHNLIAGTVSHFVQGKHMEN